MPNPLITQLQSVLPAAMNIPEPIAQLYQWIEKKRFYTDTEEGRVGSLYPESKRQRGTDVGFMAEGNRFLHHWFGHERREVLDRLCVFAKTGGEGSMAAFWIDDRGAQRIVHLGSGSGSTLVCVLADDAVDFLRLLAIGYEEICWNDEFDSEPDAVPPNVEFQKWVVKTFHTSIPRTASEIVKHPSEMGDSESDDVFNRWVSENVS